MKRVFAFEISRKGELQKLLDEDPYAEDSFARLGYKLREGKSLGEDEETIYLYLSGDEEFIGKAEKKLKDLMREMKEGEEEKVLGKIEKEEEEAGAGFGSMFG